MNDETDAPAGLEWYAFSGRYYPGRRRHDLEALKTYEAYRSAAIAPSSVPRRPDVIRRRSHRPSRSFGVSAIRADRLGLECVPDVAERGAIREDDLPVGIRARERLPAQLDL